MTWTPWNPSGLEPQIDPPAERECREHCLTTDCRTGTDAYGYCLCECLDCAEADDRKAARHETEYDQP